jgi:hypothetical protein
MYQKNDDCTRPTVVLSHAYCWDMGRIAMLMFTRSMLHSMKATKQRPMIVHRLFHRLVGATAWESSAWAHRLYSIIHSLHFIVRVGHTGHKTVHYAIKT